MQIRVAFDDRILTDYERRRSPAFFFIRIVINGADYPNSTWMDFGAVILGWWLEEVTRLAAGQNEVTLSFMDGPYHLCIVRDPLEDCLKWYDPARTLVGTTSLSELSTAVCDAARQVAERFSKINVYESDAWSLLRQSAQVEALIGSTGRQSE